MLPTLDRQNDRWSPVDFMTSHDQSLAQFRTQIASRLQEVDQEWDASRRLIEASQLADTLHRLTDHIRASNLPPAIHDLVLTALNQGKARRMQDLSGPNLKAITGLPPSKAVRALCVYFDMVAPVRPRWQVPSLDSETVSVFLRNNATPFDLLLTSNVSSLLDLGAGDLSFAAEVADLYAPKIQRQNRTLVLHCIDRLHPQSRLGGPLHPPAGLVQRLRSRSDLSFQFLSDQDMGEFDRLSRTGILAARYTLVTCWAPATPTFAYEPTRLSSEVIESELRRSKGAFRRIRYGKESALEVQHRDRTLLFPPWKFEIRGPLALLDLLARSGHLGVLGAVDSQVFWEVLAQLLEEDRYRPKDQPFTSENLPAVFGDVYHQLSTLALGEALDLSTLAPIRGRLPHALAADSRATDGYRFRSVVIRRGAVFPHMPASSTARRFGDMAEESPPWMLIVVPESD
jgi:hypothetical protein